MMKKIARIFFSMRFALVLLGILVAACIAGSVIPQGEAASYYLEAYNQQGGGAILALGLDDVFHCPWFVVLTAILCFNLTGCNIVRFPALLGKMRSGFSAEKFLAGGAKKELFRSSSPEEVFKGCGFRKLEKGQNEKGQAFIYGVKNRAGIWGAWLCHLGILVVILGFGLGQMLQVQYVVYGVPGQTKKVEDTGYELTIDSFDVDLREDDTVRQYTAAITMTDTNTGETQSGRASVNHPVSLFGMRCYQNSTGWAATMQVYQGEEMVQENVLCAGEYADISVKDGLSVFLAAFYPDYAEGEDGAPVSSSSKLNNPAYLYRLYYRGEILGMNILKEKEAITIDDLTIIFKDPQNYTLIQIRRDPFTPVAFAGALMVILALFLAFYMRTAQVCAVQGEDGMWTVSGYCRKGGAEFEDQLRKKQEEICGADKSVTKKSGAGNSGGPDMSEAEKNGGSDKNEAERD